MSRFRYAQQIRVVGIAPVFPTVSFDLIEGSFDRLLAEQGTRPQTENKRPSRRLEPEQ